MIAGPGQRPPAAVDPARGEYGPIEYASAGNRCQAEQILLAGHEVDEGLGRALLCL